MRKPNKQLAFRIPTKSENGFHRFVPELTAGHWARRSLSPNSGSVAMYVNIFSLLNKPF